MTKIENGRSDPLTEFAVGTDVAPTRTLVPHSPLIAAGSAGLVMEQFVPSDEPVLFRVRWAPVGGGSCVDMWNRATDLVTAEQRRTNRLDDRNHNLQNDQPFRRCSLCGQTEQSIRDRYTQRAADCTGVAPTIKFTGGAGRWAEFLGELDEAGYAHGQPDRTAKVMSEARRLVAAERRAERPDLVTYGPGDPEPEPFPDRIVDLDHMLWIRQPHTDAYHLALGEMRHQGSRITAPPKLLPWSYLLTHESPLTVVPPYYREARWT